MIAAVDYGNARIRARRTRLFDRRQLIGFLAAASVDRLIGLLNDTSYRPEIETVLPLSEGVRRIDAATALHLEREFDAVQGFYDEPFRSRLETFRGRWDVKNLIALVRASSGRSGRGDVVDDLLPTGRVSSPVLHELATQTSTRAMVDLIVSWNIPSPAIAHEVRSSLAPYDRTGDPRVLESAIRRGFEDEIDQAVESEPDDPLSQMLAADRMKEMLLDAARLRAVRSGREVVGGESAERRLPPAVRMLVTDPSEALEHVVGLPPGFREALERWVTTEDVRSLVDDLDRASSDFASRLYARDPLGIGVPVGYLWLAENEARNLRLIARGVAREIDPQEVEERLVTP